MSQAGNPTSLGVLASNSLSPAIECKNTGAHSFPQLGHLSRSASITSAGRIIPPTWPQVEHSTFSTNSRPNSIESTPPSRPAPASHTADNGVSELNSMRDSTAAAPSCQGHCGLVGYVTVYDVCSTPSKTKPFPNSEGRPCKCLTASVTCIAPITEAVVGVVGVPRSTAARRASSEHERRLFSRSQSTWLIVHS